MHTWRMKIYIYIYIYVYMGYGCVYGWRGEWGLVVNVYICIYIIILIIMDKVYEKKKTNLWID